ncbi:hypothetical protein [Novipirellula sp.]|uniref:hypothetical protein n=1 Tax=Novipirellula sp. TaxID=2795430 RepID=UPI00356AC726
MMNEFTPNRMLNTASLLPFRQRNAMLDSLFYDVGALTAQEQSELQTLIDREGSIIVVSPRDRGLPIRRYKNALRFINNEGDQVQAIVAAGVGSSGLGTAALARNVADATAMDVAGIVTGYGLSDVLTESLGGWFFYGSIDRWRLQWEKIGQQCFDLFPEENANAKDKGVETRRVALTGSDETGTLLDILISRPQSLKLLVGHSKGALLIDFVLEHFLDELGDGNHVYLEQLHVVTLGAIVALPHRFQHHHQFIGSKDWFGGLNSRLDIDHHSVPGAWHHLNPAFPQHLAVANVLQTVTI